MTGYLEKGTRVHINGSCSILFFSESESTTDQDQEKQARMGFLGIEANSASDPEDKEDGMAPFIYPRHISEAPPQAKRAWQVIDTWMGMENPVPIQGDTNPVT